jgi:DHA1 family multidrug resistance protein-like MFS transporter
MKSNKRRNLLILFFTLIVVMMGFGVVIPIMPFYVESFGASGSALGLLMAEYALLQFLFAPMWGQLSDRHGRKPILLAGVLGNALAMVLMGLSSQLWMLFVARAMAGILSSATLPTAMAYISDSTDESSRSGGMGMLGGAMGIGMVLGPGFGGFLAETSLSLPFYLAAGLSLIAAIIVYRILPESLPVTARKTDSGRLSGPQLGAMWQALFSPIGVLLVMAFVVSFGVTNFEGVFGLYALERFGFGTSEVGIILMGMGFVSAAIQMALTGPLTQRYGDARVIRWTLIISALGFVALPESRTFAGLFATSVLFGLGNAMLRPVISSLTSKRSDIGQGTAMGFNNAFMSLGRVVGPVWAGFTFDVHYDLPYLTGAVVMLVALAIGMVYLTEKSASRLDLSPDAAAPSQGGA